MADWKPQISYNYNTSYHAYAYGIMYPTGSEQSHHANHSVSGWPEHGANDYGTYNAGASQTNYGTRTREESSPPPPQSPEQITINNQGHYQGSGVVYLANGPSDRLFQPEQVAAAQYDPFANEIDRARSDTTASDSEAHTSPVSESWSSGSSREGSVPQTDNASWTKKVPNDETASVSPDVSSTPDEPQTFAVPRIEIMAQVPLLAPTKPSTAVHVPKGKVRTAFSESQMTTLSHRFNIQRYLTPSEMRNLASSTGLTYKQVKTWFQNRRMKLRKHQKESTWVSEQHGNKERVEPPNANNAIYANVPQHVQAYQGDAQAHVQEQYNQQMRGGAVFKKAPPPQNLAYYLTALGSGSAIYPPWPPSTHQATVVNGWPVTSAHYTYNPNTFSTAPAADTSGEGVVFAGQDEDPDCHTRSPLHAAAEQNGSQ